MSWDEFKNLLAKYILVYKLKHRNVNVAANTLFLENNEKQPFCPLSCVASFKTNQYFSFYNPSISGYELDMDREMWIDIAHAANGIKNRFYDELAALIIPPSTALISRNETI